MSGEAYPSVSILADSNSEIASEWLETGSLAIRLVPLAVPRPSLWPFVKVAFAGVFWFGVLIGGAAYVLGVF